ncbi:MAG: hypothetical protein SVR94_03715 [Pseudomonadota bacterium]|nr:hypothetical protein [Pseudomonadota bacterium]
MKVNDNDHHLTWTHGEITLALTLAYQMKQEIINITKQAGVSLPHDDFGTSMPQSLLADATRLEL